MAAIAQAVPLQLQPCMPAKELGNESAYYKCKPILSVISAYL